jgi:hypothetical protein
MERHNKAMEGFTAAKEKFIEEETRRKDNLSEIHQELNAKESMKDTNDALELYRRVSEKYELLKKKQQKLGSRTKS